MSSKHQQDREEDRPGSALLLNGNNRIDEVLSNIQPLRDLAKNWDIDIASCLDDYLQDLMEGSWQGGVAMLHPSMDSSQDTAAAATMTTNFTQAALLLQNSSGVYSRKVEYLHGLVYQALEHYSQGSMQSNNNNNNAKKKASHSRNAASDPDLDDFYAFDPHQDFLLLDDVLPLDRQGSKINLPPESKPDGGGEEEPPLHQPRNSLSRFSLTTNSRHFNNNNNNSLLLNHNSKHQHASGISLSGSIAGLPSSQNSGGGGGSMGPLRLMDTACHVSEQNGLLLWPGLGQPSTFPSATETNALGDTENADNSFVMAMTDDDHDDHDNEGDGFMMVGDDDNDHDDPVLQEQQSAAQDHTATTNNDGETTQSVVKNDPTPTTTTPTNTHWTLLDPYDATTTTTKQQRPRKLKVGKTLRLPPGLSDLPSQCVTGASTRGFSNATSVASSKQAVQPINFQSHSPFVLQVYRNGLKRKSAGRVSGVPSQINSQKGKDDMEVDEEEVESRETQLQTLLAAMKMPELDYIKNRLYKLRVAQHRREIKLLGNDRGTSAVLPRRLHLEPTAGTAQDHQQDDDEYANGEDAYDDGHDCDNDDDGYVTTPEEGNPIYNNNAGVMSVLDALPHHPTTGSSTSESGHQLPPSFDELCRAHIQAFAKSAQRFATETKLTQRVGEWQAKLLPLLQEEEARPVFDIYIYSDQVISAMQQELDGREGNNKYNKATKATKELAASHVLTSNVVDFQTVTKDCAPFEVCRLFLASLSLANSGNVQLLPKASELSSLDTLPMELLQTDIDRPMETYLAPSAAAAEAQTHPNPRKRLLEA